MPACGVANLSLERLGPSAPSGGAPLAPRSPRSGAACFLLRDIEISGTCSSVANHVEHYRHTLGYLQ